MARLLVSHASLGFAFDRPGLPAARSLASQETGRKVTLPHHARDLAAGTLRAVLRVAGIDVEEFLKA